MHFEKIMNNAQARPVAPFQFIFPILEAIYNGFIGAAEPNIDNFWDWKNDKPKWHAHDPKDYEKAHNDSPVRAIAFFSWEESSRVFLLRRVFPTYFGFLSYSQCPENWGAVGEMLTEMKRERQNYFKRPWDDGDPPSAPFCTQIGRFSQRAMPFLVEVERLKFSAITVFPVVRNAHDFQVTDQLLGVFLVLLEDAKYLPSRMLPADGGKDERRRFTDGMGKLSVDLTQLLDSQMALFSLANQKSTDLPELWLKRAENHRKDVRILQLDFYPEGNGDNDGTALASDLISALSTAGLCCVLRARAELNGPISILVAPPPPLDVQACGISDAVRAVASHKSIVDHFSITVRVAPVAGENQAARVIIKI